MKNIVVYGFVIGLLGGCATVQAPSSYKFEPKDGEIFGTVIVLNESTDVLWIRVDNEFLVFHPGKTDGPHPFGQGPYDCEPKGTMVLKMTTGMHKIKWNLKESSSGSSGKFEVPANKRIKVIIPTAKLFGVLNLGVGTSTNLKVEEMNDSESASPHQVNKISPCARDIANYCEGVSPGKGRVLKCLKRHRDEVSKRCREDVDKY